MKRPYKYVDGNAALMKLRSILENIEVPVFVQLHSMMTLHGNPKKGLQVFLEFLRELVNYLKEHGRYENSIFILTSDHGQNYVWNKRLPLIIKFPDKVDIPNLSINAQSIDIPVTILDYLGVSLPDWMEGDSLLQPLDKNRKIITIESSDLEKGLGLYPMGNNVIGGASALGMIVCDRYFRLDLKTGQIQSDKIKDYTSPCDESYMPDINGIKNLMIIHLKNRGFDVQNIGLPPL